MEKAGNKIISTLTLMKTILLTINLFFAVLYVQAQQGPVPKKQGHKLTVIIVPGSHYDLIDKAWLSGNKVSLHKDWTYDKTNSTHRYTYTNLTTGSYAFCSRDVWRGIIRQELRVWQDTTVVLPATSYKLVEQMTRADLQAADSIKMYYDISSCFFSATDYVLLTKNKDQNNYTLIFSFPHSKAYRKANNLPVTIVNELYASLQTIPMIDTNSIGTTTQRFALLAGNKLFYINDQSGEWQGYQEFVSGYTGQGVLYNNSKPAKKTLKKTAR